MRELQEEACILQAYEKLAKEVIMVACEDYLRALRVIDYNRECPEVVERIKKERVKAHGKIYIRTLQQAEDVRKARVWKAEADVRACIDFFHSDQFRLYSDMKPDRLIERLNFLYSAGKQLHRSH